MLPAPGALLSPSMGCGGAVNASARLGCASCPASTPRARPISAPAPCTATVAPSQGHGFGQPTGPDVSPGQIPPGLLHLRGVALGACTPRLRASVRTAAVAGRAADTAVSPPASTSFPFTNTREHRGPLNEGAASWGRHLSFRSRTLRSCSSTNVSASVGGCSGVGPINSSAHRCVVRTCAAGAAASAATASLTSPLAAAATVAAAPLPLGPRYRQLCTQVNASGQSGEAAKKQQQQDQQKQSQNPPPAVGSSANQATAAASDAAATAAAPPQQQSTSTVRYSPLHYNIEEFCSRVVPTEGEKRQRMEVVAAIRAGVRKVWPNARQVELQVFGSFANGLSTWNSDLDLVVTGIMEPDRVSGGYEPADRAKITARLRKIADALNRAKNIEILRQQLIPRARIPILKLWTKSRVCVDVSVSDDSGPRAARYMVQQCRAFPPVKPLVLVLKTYLKACRLNEVNSGGLSSYSLTNMVIAHLQEELKSGHDISDLGETLYTFLLRYGEEHDYSSQAVSVGSGGIISKMSLGYAMESARQAAASMGSYDGAVSWNERLFVDCPLTGRDVSNGTYRIDLVKGAFQQAARRLEAMAQGRRITDTSINYLQALFDVNRALKRSYPDPHEPYEDEYLKVIGRSGDEEDREELALGGGADVDGNGDDDDLDGDYLERSPTTAGAQNRR
ncbi:hypothetical protein Vretimale_16704 [Volvox reticuliferus]|uniref:Poly(A) RNA polymerase mitochondrial-like central palm domain-containing protein n=1 Tax=Volvox reticuliferus TaxID=1737510 RepID=A0A8J4FNB3_9CHLO|nr:hypothetical protein Vretifemale_8542 [Volvox reticuliferus]GIM13638.1 hypothetical protein Vretimale_16704 [Volvox reticuliferus]